MGARAGEPGKVETLEEGVGVRLPLDGVALPPAGLPEDHPCRGWGGHSCSFWHDVWAGEESLTELFPALYSHTTVQEATMAEVVSRGLDRFLIPLLSRQTMEDRKAVTNLLSSTVLTREEDVRACCFVKSHNRLHTAQVYRVSIWVGPDILSFISCGAAMPRRG